MELFLGNPFHDLQGCVETSACGTRASPLRPIRDPYPDRNAGYFGYQITLLTADQQPNRRNHFIAT